MSRTLSIVSLVCVVAILSSSIAFAVVPVTSGLRVHLTAETGLVTSGNDVSQWTDQSGNGNHLFQATTANQPDVVANVFNGKPVVRFDGDLSASGVNADWMQSTTPISGMITNNAYTAFVVYKTPQVFRNTGPGYTNDMVFGDNQGYFGLFDKNNGPTSYAYNFDGSDDQAAIPLTLNQLRITDIRHESGVLYINSWGVGSDSVASGNTSFLAGVLGIANGFVQNQTVFRGDIAELLIYNRALNATERADVQLYLQTNWVPEPSSAGLVLLTGGFLASRRRFSKTR